MRGRWLTAVAAGAAFSFLLSGCGAAGTAKDEKNEPEYVFTYAENQPEDYPTSQGAYRFAELVKERTDGRILIQVKTDGAMGAEQSVIEQLQFGGLDFARVSLSALADQIPKLNVLQLPYLYTGSDHMWKVLEGEIGDGFLDSFDGSGMIALSWYDAGARSFYSSKKAIERLEDMKGMRIRVQDSAMMKRMVEELGGVPVALEYDEVYSALQTGIIDGAENNWPSYESMNHHQVAGFFTTDEHSRVPEVQLASQTTWEKLSEEDQAVIRQCAQESAQYERRLWASRSQESEDKVRDEGCVVIELGTAEKARFQAAMAPVYDEFCGEYKDIIEEITAAGRE